jgi:hypothetical protein
MILTAGDDKENKETRCGGDGNINESGDEGFKAIQCIPSQTFGTD